MNVYGGVEVQLYSLLVSAPDEVSGQLYAPAALTLETEPRYPLNSRLGGPQRRSGHYGEEENLLPTTGIEPRFLGRPARRLVTMSTELSRLHVNETVFV
jgi:hypothetical protein